MQFGVRSVSKKRIKYKKKHKILAISARILWKVAKIAKNSKNILPDTLVCFTIVKNKGVRKKQMA